MSRISSASSDLGQTQTTARSQDITDVDVMSFLDLMIAELQNQDPLNPLDNAAMIEQIGQIREISSTNRLTETLSNVIAGQNLSTASTLLGRKISALDDGGNQVEGVVDRVSVQDRDDATGSVAVKVHVGSADISLSNIRGIIGAV